jgi:hypothetical protein
VAIALTLKIGDQFLGGGRVYDSLGDRALRRDLCFASEEGLQLGDGCDGLWDVLGC